MHTIENLKTELKKVRTISSNTKRKVTSLEKKLSKEENDNKRLEKANSKLMLQLQVKQKNDKLFEECKNKCEDLISKKFFLEWQIDWYKIELKELHNKYKVYIYVMIVSLILNITFFFV